MLLPGVASSELQNFIKYSHWTLHLARILLQSCLPTVNYCNTDWISVREFKFKRTTQRHSIKTLLTAQYSMRTRCSGSGSMIGTAKAALRRTS